MTQVGDRLEHAIEERADVEHEIERGEAEQPARKKLVRTAFWLAVTGISLYLVAPSLLDTLGSWEDLDRLSPAWLGLMFALQTGMLACVWALQYLAMRGPSWPAVISSQLAGNALAKIAPGGGAHRWGAAVPDAGPGRPPGPARGGRADRREPADLRGRARHAGPRDTGHPARGRQPRPARGGGDRRRRVHRAVRDRGAADRHDGALAWVGRVIQRVRNRLRRHSEPLQRLPERLLRERDRIVGTLGPRWKRALAATSGRWAFDYATLLAALAAVGSQPRPSLVLLAFCAAQILAQIPITPGGLGFVEAGLTAMLDAGGRLGRRRGAGHVRLPALLVLAAAAGRARRLRLARAALSRSRDRHLIGHAGAAQNVERGRLHVGEPEL